MYKLVFAERETHDLILTRCECAYILRPLHCEDWQTCETNRVRTFWECKDNANCSNIFKGCLKKRFALKGRLRIWFVGNLVATVKVELKA